ncbi:MAG: helix-turn-helix domain-containing protein [Streptosporangiaceae bacterium]
MAVMADGTVLPPEHPEGLSGVLALLAPQPGGHATLTGPDGTGLELPGEIFEVLRDVVAALAQGLAITVAPHQTVLSTSEAATLLGVSRPTLVRLLEAGEIPFSQPGRHRRVRLADLLAYQQRASRGRAVPLDQMAADSEDAGLYDPPGEAPLERLPVNDDQKSE